MKEEKYILEQFDLGSDRINASNVEDGVFFEKVAFYASQIDTPSVDVSSAWNDFSAKHLKTKTKVRTLNFNMMYRVAAVLVVALVTSWFLFFNSEQIHTELA
ncbi:MAG: anti-sigma factor, partial [Bacteroidia bacterium]|nr:anti-sigma factor [Bacteroidia bacterium]